MRWIMFLSLFGFLVFSIAAGIVAAEWVTQRFHSDITVMPAIEHTSKVACPGQKQVCPVGKKAQDSRLKV